MVDGAGQFDEISALQGRILAHNLPTLSLTSSLKQEAVLQDDTKLDQIIRNSPWHSGRESPDVPWQICSYTDTSTLKDCGREITLTGPSGQVQRRWLLPNASYGSMDGLLVYEQDAGLQQTTRIIVNDEGIITDATVKDFVVVDGIKPLLGWHAGGLKNGDFNINNCPITYACQAEVCIGKRSPGRFSIADYPSNALIPMILDTDLGIFMDDPFAIAFAANNPKLDLKMIITTSRNTSASALIAAKQLFVLGKVNSSTVIAAGGSSLPEEEQLLTEWALTPPEGVNMSAAAWRAQLADMISISETNSPETAQVVATLVADLRKKGIISSARPLVYYMIGPAESLGLVMDQLSIEDKKCMLLVAMGGSIVPGVKLFFGPTSGMSSWAETNTKGGDSFPDQPGKDVTMYNDALHADWAGVILGTSDAVCASQFGEGMTAPTWAAFKKSNTLRAKAMMNMMYASGEAAAACTSSSIKCTPHDEAKGMLANNFSKSPAQCDAMSLMPFISPEHFLLEPKLLSLLSGSGGSGEVRGCAVQDEPMDGRRCINVVTSYRMP